MRSWRRVSADLDVREQRQVIGSLAREFEARGPQLMERDAAAIVERIEGADRRHGREGPDRYLGTAKPRGEQQPLSERSPHVVEVAGHDDGREVVKAHE